MKKIVYVVKFNFAGEHAELFLTAHEAATRIEELKKVKIVCNTLTAYTKEIEV